MCAMTLPGKARAAQRPEAFKASPGHRLGPMQAGWRVAHSRSHRTGHGSSPKDGIIGPQAVVTVQAPTSNSETAKPRGCVPH